MIWKHPGSPVKKNQDNDKPGKGDATVFWDMHGVLLAVFTPRGARSSAIRYQGIPAGHQEAISLKRHGLVSHGALLLHDDAWPHIAITTVNPLNTWHWDFLSHSPYSPDLAPSDFHFFPELKKHFREPHFQADEDVQ
jgi:hypothetical protein